MWGGLGCLDEVVFVVGVGVGFGWVVFVLCGMCGFGGDWSVCVSVLVG